MITGSEKIDFIEPKYFQTDPDPQRHTGVSGNIIIVFF